MSRVERRERILACLADGALGTKHQAGEERGALPTGLKAGLDLHFAVHQASGMVAVQLGVSVDEALARMRAYAFTSQRPLDEVARDVVQRELRFRADQRLVTNAADQ